MIALIWLLLVQLFLNLQFLIFLLFNASVTNIDHCQAPKFKEVHALALPLY